MQTVNELATILITLLLCLSIISVISFIIYVLIRCQRDGLYILAIEGRSISPSSLQSLLLLFATIIGGLWVAFSIFITGTIDAQRFALEKARIDSVPILTIEMQVQALSSYISTNGTSLYPLVVSVQVENKGASKLALDFQKIPMVTVTKIQSLEPQNWDTSEIVSLPYAKIECIPQSACTASKWKYGSLEGDGGRGYYTFLHPGLLPGLYHVQFGNYILYNCILEVVCLAST